MPHLLQTPNRTKLHQWYDAIPRRPRLATIRKTITRIVGQDAGIAAKIEAGSYTNDSKAIPDLIRREQERSVEVETLNLFAHFPISGYNFPIAIGEIAGVRRECARLQVLAVQQNYERAGSYRRNFRNSLCPR